MRPTPAEQPVLDAVAARFGQQHPALEALTGGLGNRSWRMRDAGRDLVVRFGGAQAVAFGVNRGDEVRAQSVAATRGLAPEVLWYDLPSNLMVTEFVPGRVWSPAVARQPACAQRLGAWLRALHRLDVPDGLAQIDFLERATRLSRSLPPGSVPGRFLERAADQRRRLDRTATPVLCHHDLHHLNIVESDAGLIVLDWEYAGAGEPVMDLAGFVAYHDLDPDATAALLDGYTGGTGQPGAMPLAPARWLFEFVWWLWLELRRAAAGGEGADLAVARRRLAARLEAQPGD